LKAKIQRKPRQARQGKANALARAEFTKTRCRAHYAPHFSLPRFPSPGNSVRHTHPAYHKTKSSQRNETKPNEEKKKAKKTN